MDNAQKAIMVGVGLFITIVIISVVLVITNLGQGVTDDSTGILSGLSTAMQQKLFTRYVNKDLSSSELDTFVSSYGSRISISVRYNGKTKICTSSEDLRNIGISSKLSYMCTYDENDQLIIIECPGDLRKYSSSGSNYSTEEAIKVVNIIWGTTIHIRIYNAQYKNLTGYTENGFAVRNDYQNLVQADINNILKSKDVWNIKRIEMNDKGTLIEFKALT